VLEPIDGIAFLGHNPMDADNVFVITGDSGHGLTHGTIGAMLITDLVMGRANPWQELYEPSRKTLSAAGELLRNSMDVARHMGDWLAPGDVSSVNEIQCGEGAIVREGLSLQW